MRVAVNFVWNFLGTGLPLLVAVATIPPLIEGMGTARFGVLSLAWIVVGYFSLFDLGLGRALTQLVAQRIGTDRETEIPSLVWMGMALMTVLGIAGAVVVGVLSPWLVGSKLEIPDDLRSETLVAFYLLAVSLPIVIGTTALRGILEAYQRFDIVNMVRAPLGVLTYLGPMAVLPFSNGLPAMVLTLVIARAVSFAVYLAVCARQYPNLVRPSAMRVDLLKQLLSFGGWMTLSNVAAPLLLYMGRLALAILVSAQAVAYFATPYDVVINLLIIPSVLVGVLFPTFAQQFPVDQAAVTRLYKLGMRFIGLVMLPATAIIYLLAKPALGWWINQDFAENSYRVAQLLAVGIFINSFGHLSQALVQAYGRPDLTAKLHVAELAAYSVYLWWLIERHGVEGAAMAWVARVAISTTALWLIANGCLAGSIKNSR